MSTGRSSGIPLFSTGRNVIGGQLVSLFMSLTGVFTTLLVNNGTSSPLLQSTCVYATIAIVSLPVLFRRMNVLGHKAVPHAWWKYALIALFDLEANYTVVLAYRYTDLTSVQLLDCFTIPCVMVLSKLLVVPKPKYTKYQFLGAALAIVGLIILVMIDMLGDSRTKNQADAREGGSGSVVAATLRSLSHPHHRSHHGVVAAAALETTAAPSAGSGSASGGLDTNIALGDALCLLASFLYAMSNVLCERLLKDPTVQHSEREAAGEPTHQPSSPSPVAVGSTGSEGDGELGERQCGKELKTPTRRDPTSSSGRDYFCPTAATSGREEEEETARDLSGAGGPRPEGQSNTTNRGVPSFADALQSTLSYLALMSMFATAFSILQFSCLELRSFTFDAAPKWTRYDTAYQAGFTLVMLGIYLAMPLLFIYSSAAFANISLLSSDVYALFWNIVIFSVDPKPLYFIPFSMTIGGVVVFDLLKAKNTAEGEEKEGGGGAAARDGDGGGDSRTCRSGGGDCGAAAVSGTVGYGAAA